MQGKVFKQLIKHEEAQEALEDLVKFLGMGFHPDNLAGEYINNTGRTFSETQAKLIDKNLGIIFEAIQIFMRRLYHYGIS